MSATSAARLCSSIAAARPSMERPDVPAASDRWRLSAPTSARRAAIWSFSLVVAARADHATAHRIR